MIQEARRTVVCKLALGKTRISGYTLYNNSTMAFEETTPRVVKQMVKAGLVNGLALDADEEIVPDTSKYKMKSLFVKSGVGNYSSYFSSGGANSGFSYALTKVAETKEGRIYEVVTHECARLPFNEKAARSLCQLNVLNGCELLGDDEVITPCPGVEMVDMRNQVDMAVISGAVTMVDGKETVADVNPFDSTEGKELAKDILDELCQGQEEQHITALIMKQSVFDELLEDSPAPEDEAEAEDLAGSVFDTLTQTKEDTSNIEETPDPETKGQDPKAKATPAKQAKRSHKRK